MSVAVTCQAATGRGVFGAGLLFVWLGFGSGCAGSGRLELAALNYRAIDPPAARTVQLDLDRCYWWTNEQGRVCIAMQQERWNALLPKFKFDFQASLVLDEPPAGRARDYVVSPRVLRGLVRAGPALSRFTSAEGVAALYRESGQRLRGSFRMRARREVAQLLGGWSRPVNYLLQGTFTAVHDEGRGRAILEVTEANGWEREEAGAAPSD